MSANTTQIPHDALQDVCSRFLLNLPDSEKNDFIRLCFQMELAHWFYLDFYCNPDLSGKSSCPQVGVRDFIRQACAFLPYLNVRKTEVDAIVDQWRNYKLSIPTYGAILLDETLSCVLLVQGMYAKSSWGFPKGKVNEFEQPHRCAIREVLEEVGYDISGLVDVTDFLEKQHNEGIMRLYMVPNVDKHFQFETRTRNEIKQIKWFSIHDLPRDRADFSKASIGLYPNHFYNVVPFVDSIVEWISMRRGGGRKVGRKQRTRLASQRGSPVKMNTHGSYDYSRSLSSNDVIKFGLIGANSIQNLRKLRARPQEGFLFHDAVGTGQQDNITVGHITIAQPVTPGVIRKSRTWQNFRINWEPIFAGL